MLQPWWYLFSGATSLSSVSKYKLTNSTPFSIRVLISLQVIPNLHCLHSNELPSRRNSFLLDVGICIHGKGKKDLLAKLACNPHMQLRMYVPVLQSWEWSIKGTLHILGILLSHCSLQASSTLKMIRCLCLLCLIDDLSQSRHNQNLSHSFALNSIWPHKQDSKDNTSWGMNTLINIQKQGERNSQEIDHLQISDDNASKSALKSPWSFPWVPKLWRWVSCHQSPPTTSSYLSTTHPAPSIKLLNIINHVKQTSNGHWHQQKNNQISFQDK